MTVVIGIIDSNDLGPKFAMSRYNATVSEDAVVGTHVIAVQAVDMDAVRSVFETYLKVCHCVFHFVSLVNSLDSDF